MIYSQADKEEDKLKQERDRSADNGERVAQTLQHHEDCWYDGGLVWATDGQQRDYRGEQEWNQRGKSYDAKCDGNCRVQRLEKKEQPNKD